MKTTAMALALSALFLSAGLSADAQSTVLKVQAGQPKAEIQSTMWGIFFEDINFAADGGIYAELIKNRSFEFSDPLMGWKQYESDRFSRNKQSGSILIINRVQENATNPHVARVSVNTDKAFVISNEGFRGIGIKKDAQYDFSIWASQQEGSESKLLFEVNAQGKVIGQASVTISGKAWKKYTASFKATDTAAKAQATLHFTGKGVTDIDMVSLFPQDTWKQRPGGFRSDLVQLLADMKPGFIRFPGGCIVEGFHLSTRYQWKKTIGAPEERESMINRWNTEFKHRLAPDYYQSFGVGFYEYFQLAEDIGASPLPILSCGMACQFNSAEVAPLDALDPYVQDALDLIEFANGPIDSPWGKIRATMGHPAPFNLKFIGVGNEQWGEQYIERYKIFTAAIKSKYPDIKVVSSAGPFPEGELFAYASNELKTLHADIVDEHYYNNPQWFFKNAGRYDNYDRSGPKIFAGEFAAQSVGTTSPENKNNWLCALSEAAFMTGLERNADMVTMASYAPLFAHAEGWQWTPDLIWFDNLNAYGTPNYYVQKLFSTNKGTNVLPVLLNNQPVEGQQELYASAAWDKNTKEIIVKVVNAGTTATKTEFVLEGSGKYAATAKKITLVNADPNAVNSFESPKLIAPQESTTPVAGKKVSVSLAPQSFTILKIQVK
ncbi:alpha-L-arabinofuranosidase C-terminal domain-containing protein [Chryseolinea lacunae]|uniref:non-reducing end alpha-L-arabinofuranosidase n=1 Tax=Chryseolinea lacunae TaxID=2801331 RepID=A0ABS1L1V7_9BACT|nr:alpha-L-arabinofuranosidase C-terminal domain-containing protein [Chryseolinea lacunae]MBL0745423.1 carbohydrate binding domain-containing protein [Chryseolinea lacunae]